MAIAFIFLKRQNQITERRYEAKSENLQNYLDRIVALSQSSSIQNGLVDKVEEEILEVINTTLNVSRVSIWTYIPETNWIECNRLLENGKISTNKTILDCNECPRYIGEIKKNKILLAHDTASHSALSEMGEYLEKYDIKSMMDIPFYRDNQLGGVICVEQQKTNKAWLPEDSIFVKTLSDFMSYALIMNKLTHQYEIIKEKSDEINAINEHLEFRIINRTSELEDKNEQLSEYAFLNSHKLRGPIARIEGLFNVLELTQVDKIPSEILQPIRDSIDELDKVSREINRSIEHYGTLSRDHVEEVLSNN